MKRSTKWVIIALALIPLLVLLILNDGQNDWIAFMAWISMELAILHQACKYSDAEVAEERHNEQIYWVEKEKQLGKWRSDNIKPYSDWISDKMDFMVKNAEMFKNDAALLDVFNEGIKYQFKQIHKICDTYDEMKSFYDKKIRGE